jgi:hypothetical protein
MSVGLSHGCECGQNDRIEGEADNITQPCVPISWRRFLEDAPMGDDIHNKIEKAPSEVCFGIEEHGRRSLTV